MSYIAHVITEGAGLGDPEVVVMTQADEVGAAAPIVSYTLPPGSDPGEVLTEHGWRVLGVAATEPYHLYEVEPTDWVGLVRTVTEARAAARTELERKDTAWRHVIRDAMSCSAPRVSRKKLADAAGVTTGRLHQVKYGRR